MHNDIHAAPLEELRGALTHVFEVCGARGDDVDHAEDALFSGSMGVVVVVVRVGMRM